MHVLPSNDFVSLERVRELIEMEKENLEKRSQPPLQQGRWMLPLGRLAERNIGDMETHGMADYPEQVCGREENDGRSVCLQQCILGIELKVVRKGYEIKHGRHGR